MNYSDAFYSGAGLGYEMVLSGKFSFDTQQDELSAIEFSFDHPSSRRWSRLTSSSSTTNTTTVDEGLMRLSLIKRFKNRFYQLLHNRTI